MLNTLACKCTDIFETPYGFCQSRECTETRSFIYRESIMVRFKMINQKSWQMSILQTMV